MKGMLVKDFKLMKGQRNFFAVIAAMAVGMAIFMEEPSFIIGYMTFAGSLFTLSTISYDEFDNGNAFLFSLPISRKGYTVEKYQFGLIAGGVSWLFATVAAGIAGVDRAALAGIGQGNHRFSRPAGPGGGRGKLPHHILIHICSRKHASGVLLSIGAMTVYAKAPSPVHDARMMEGRYRLYSKQASCQRT